MITVYLNHSGRLYFTDGHSTATVDKFVTVFNEKRNILAQIRVKKIVWIDYTDPQSNIKDFLDKNQITKNL